MIYLVYCSYYNIIFIVVDVNYYCKFMCKIYIVILIYICMDYK